MYKKTFGDLITGDSIYYVDYCELEDCFKIYEYSIIVSDNTLEKDKYIVIETIIKPGFPLKHRYSGFLLPKNDSEKVIRSSYNNITGNDYFFADYQYAKEKCLNLMFKLCEKKREKAVKAFEEYNVCWNKLKRYYEDDKIMKG